MKSLIALTFAVLLLASACHAPSGHRSQAWHPGAPKKAKQGRNH